MNPLRRDPAKDSKAVWFSVLLHAEHWTAGLPTRCLLAATLVVLAWLGERLLAVRIGGASPFLLLTPLAGAVGIYAGAGPGLLRSPWKLTTPTRGKSFRAMCSAIAPPKQ